MKHFTLRVLTLATAASSLVFTSCEKDDEDSKSKTELLTARNWRISADATAATNGTNTNTVDNYASYAACAKDDYLKFESNKILREDEGPIRCGTNPQSSNGAWDFNADETTLFLTSSDLGPTAAAFNLVELTESTMTIRIGTSLNGVAASRTITFTAF